MLLEAGRRVVAAEIRARLAEQRAAAAEQRATAAERRAVAAEQAASVDPLTGALNALGWRQALASEDARTRRSRGRTVLVMVDVDDLKAVNDHQGHLAGDLLLRLTADCLRAAVRPHDSVARIGGDEFGILIVDYQGISPGDVVHRIDTELAARGVSASVGAAVHEPPASLSDACARADEAMYATKRLRKRAEVAAG
jgi:diguanylate cyclase (GGDEF)-like protein